jgi:hypothetical protein
MSFPIFCSVSWKEVALGFENEISDRRGASRFTLTRQLVYNVLSSCGSQHPEAGTTVDMSSKGVLFTTNAQLLLGQQLEISMRWSIAANLIARATVVRIEGRRVALEIQH